MESFEELDLAPELIEGLAAEGIERPTPLQAVSIPVLARGNNLVMAAGPGSGTLVAYGAALLARIEPERNTPSALVLTPTADAAQRLAESLGRLSLATGHDVAALGSPWVLPDRAHILFGTPNDVLSGIRTRAISPESVQAMVLDQAGHIEKLGGLESVEQILDFLPREVQRVIVALPVTPALDDFVERHARRAIRVPTAPTEVLRRGELRFRVVSEAKDEATLAATSELLNEGHRHVMVFVRSEDRAADLGDYLTLHGFVAGVPGDASVPVWLGVNALEARESAVDVDGVTVLSCDAPTDPDTLEHRHGISGGGMVLILPREVRHLRDVARRAGYKVVPAPPEPTPARDEVARIRTDLRRALEEEDYAAYVPVLEPLLEEFSAIEVAAAATALQRRKAPRPAEPARSVHAPSVHPPPPPAWARLFIGVGQRDELSPGDLVGAITGEAGVQGGQIGRIDIKENFSIVEVHEPVARKVIQALNGTTIRGRSVRADFDRAGSRKSEARRRR